MVVTLGATLISGNDIIIQPNAELPGALLGLSLGLILDTKKIQEKTPDKDNKPVMRYILDNYLDATGEHISHLNEAIAGQNFRPLEQRKRLRLMSALYNLGRKSTVKILDDPVSTPIIEIHLSISLKANQVKDLALNYVLCLGDRKRIATHLANVQGWHKCQSCDQWFCHDCITEFQSIGAGCPSVAFGHASHQMKFVAQEM